MRRSRLACQAGQTRRRPPEVTSDPDVLAHLISSTTASCRRSTYCAALLSSAWNTSQGNLRLVSALVGEALLSRDGWERAKIVTEDLEYLADDWRPSLDDQQLRRDSPILRRLLVDDQYGHAWRDLGLPDQPFISAPELAAGLGETNRDYIQYATAPPGVTVANSLLAGGQLQMGILRDIPKGSGIGVAPGYGQQHGVILAAIPPDVMAAAAATGQDAVTANLKPGRRHVVGQPISEFLDSSFALILGIEITRRDVIKYVANKLGGAHFDPSRNRRGDNRLKLLDSFARTRLEIAGKRPFNAVYVELLSIAEYLAESSDASRFREAFRKTPRPE